MKANSIIYLIKKANEEEILSHLKQCDLNFSPPLSERVNLEEYSKKIADKAVTFEAWSENTLVGLIAAYMNAETKTAFITNVSVLKSFMGLGIAAELTKRSVEYVKLHHFKEIKLEVHKNNISAISLYKKFNFTTYDSKGDQDLMKVEIE